MPRPIWANIVRRRNSSVQGTPYVVGRWVRGDEHYDRQSLIDYLLNAQDTAIWVVGTRRMGKTSLLRQIEHLTGQPGSPYASLFWDLQGGATPHDLTQELCWIIDLASERLGLAEADIETFNLLGDAVTILRQLSRLLRRQDRQLLLLVDEAEVLLEIADRDPAWLARLRKAMQEGHLRTIMTSTRQLSQLTERNMEWTTSPFLFGFHMVVLWPLKHEGAAALVRQLQGDVPVDVDEGVLEEILRYTHHHPYLIQYLCEKLYSVDEDGVGQLRAVREEDLNVDSLLAGYLQLDYQRLTELEQRILVYVAGRGTVAEDDLADHLGEQHTARLPGLLQALRELGHLRETPEGWTVGSEFMRRWLLIEMGDLHSQPAAATVDSERLDESNIDSLARSLGVSVERVRALTNYQIRSEAEFFGVVRSFFYEIRHLVEQDEGYRLLVTHGAEGKPTLRSEEEIQIALKHWLRPMCRALNIDMDRESMTGRGLLDFKFSIGHDFRCLAEVKLYHSAKLQDGLTLQLPIYLMADKATYGIYVPIFLEADDYGEQVRTLQALASTRARSHGVVLDVVDIRAARPRSASKADTIDEAARYQPAALPNRNALPSPSCDEHAEQAHADPADADGSPVASPPGKPPSKSKSTSRRRKQKKEKPES